MIMERCAAPIVSARFALCLALAVSLTHALAPPPVPPSAAVNLNLNGPSLLELVRTPEARSSTIEKAKFLGQSAGYFVGPNAVSIDPPTDIKGFVGQALKGQASVSISTGLKNVPSQQLDVQILASDWGAVTVQIRNPLLPKLPLVGLPDTPPLVSNMVAPLATQASPVAFQVAQKVTEAALNQEPPPPPFWTTPIQDGTVAIDLAGGYHHAITPLDILGSSSLALGAAYAGSYAYYLDELEREAQDAEERKKAAAAKRAAAAKKKDTPSPPTSSSTQQSKGKKTAAKAESVPDEPVPKLPPSPVIATAVKESAPAKVNLPVGEPQLQRTIDKESSIALAKDEKLRKDDDDDDDDTKAVAPKEEKKKRGGIFRIFRNLFRRQKN